MSEFVVDTHALYWYLAESSRLSDVVREILRGADEGIHHVYVPGVVLVELVYLAERGRVENGPVTRAFNLFGGPAGTYRLAALDQHTALAMREVPRAVVADMPDRIITATARQLGLPLITRDAAIHRSGVVTVVW
ncbi:MAG: type II toxin-antitoxin system VapC family toxin [Thermomicrobiales bacterium]